MVNKSALFWIRVGAVMAALAVVFGAFGAHGLEPHLLKLYEGKSREMLGQTVPDAVKYLGDFKTAAEYQMYHALGLISVGLLSLRRSTRSAQVAGWSLLIGILLFSGSLYVLVLSGIKVMGAITPFGGVAFIIGWIALLFATFGFVVEDSGKSA